MGEVVLHIPNGSVSLGNPGENKREEWGRTRLVKFSLTR